MAHGCGKAEPTLKGAAAGGRIVKLTALADERANKKPGLLAQTGPVPASLPCCSGWRRDVACDQKRYSALTETKSESSLRPLFSAL